MGITIVEKGGQGQHFPARNAELLVKFGLHDE
jgi:hypothetical protein